MRTLPAGFIAPCLPTKTTGCLQAANLKSIMRRPSASALAESLLRDRAERSARKPSTSPPPRSTRCGMRRKNVGWWTQTRAEERDARLLPACCKRPYDCSAAEKRNELAPLHSITSSARASRVGGMVRRSALAVSRLTMKSNLVGCSTGMSAGLVPRRILST
jgi:hypothetical protein